MSDLQDANAKHATPDLILGADLVYSEDLADALGTNLSKVVSNPSDTVDVIIAATQRNNRTLDLFETSWDAHRGPEGALTKIEYKVPSLNQQRGLFHTLATEIRMYDLRNTGGQ